MKYTSELKKEAVRLVLEKNHTVIDVANILLISDSSITFWVRLVKEHGYDILEKKRRKNYSGDFKVNAVEYMHKNHLSLSEAAPVLGIPTTSTLGKWEKVYYEKGPQGLKEWKPCKKLQMKKRPENKTTKIDTIVEKNLIIEVKELRMENEYLKKLNALVLERIKRENAK